MMKVLITGCYGFIGYNFIKHLQAIYEDDILIYGIDKLTNSYSNFNSQVDDTINFFHADMHQGNLFIDDNGRIIPMWLTT